MLLKLEKTVYASSQRLWREGKVRDLPGILLRRTKNIAVLLDTLYITLMLLRETTDNMHTVFLIDTQQ